MTEETSAKTGPTLAAIFTPDQPPERLGAATVGEYAGVGATHIAVNADADLERFVGFLASEVSPLVGLAAGG